MRTETTLSAEKECKIDLGVVGVDGIPSAQSVADPGYTREGKATEINKFHGAAFDLTDRKGEEAVKMQFLLVSLDEQFSSYIKSVSNTTPC
jgi:hypothetical protein